MGLPWTPEPTGASSQETGDRRPDAHQIAPPRLLARSSQTPPQSPSSSVPVAIRSPHSLYTGLSRTRPCTVEFGRFHISLLVATAIGFPFQDTPERDRVFLESDVKDGRRVAHLGGGRSPRDPRARREDVQPNSNGPEGRTDLFVRYSEDSIETEHTYPSAHSVLNVDGTMDIHGHVVASGDYIDGQSIPGPDGESLPPVDYRCLGLPHSSKALRATSGTRTPTSTVASSSEP